MTVHRLLLYYVLRAQGCSVVVEGVDSRYSISTAHHAPNTARIVFR